jgi:tRNA threonylcarbamoyladenosine biosynthesis protein TsaE
VSSEWSQGVRTEDPEGTRSVAATLARAARPGDLVLLIGRLGAGKTVFAQGFARGLGVLGPVTSPTFTLVRQYPCEGGGPVRQLIHADLYRLEHLAEVADLALPELVEDQSVALIEWGDVGRPVLGDSALEIELTTIGDATETDGQAEPRLVTLSARGAQWFDRQQAVRALLEPFAGGRPVEIPR